MYISRKAAQQLAKVAGANKRNQGRTRLTHKRRHVTVTPKQVQICRAGAALVGDHPTYSDWLATVGGSGLFQNVWPMRLGRISRMAGAGSDPPLFTASGDTIDVLNLHYGEYIPWHALVTVFSIDGIYVCSYQMPATLFGTIDGDLTSGGPTRNLTITGSMQGDVWGSTVIPISSHHVPSGKKITSGAYCWANKIGYGQYRITGSNRAMVDA